MSVRGNVFKSIDRSDGSVRSDRDDLARLRAVVDAAVDGIFTFDDCGVIETANRSASQMFGYSAEDLSGMNIDSLMSEPYRGGHVAIGVSREVEAVRRDGSTFAMELVISETRIGNHKFFTAVARDISARRQAERALRESEERFAAFMRHLPGAAWIKDRAGRYVYVNPEAERIFNSSLESLRGKTDDEVFPPETARQFSENDRRVLEEGSGIQTIEVLRQDDQIDHRSIVRKFTVPDVDGRSAYIAGVAFDITEWLAAQDALRLSEERFRRMADCAPVMIWISGTDKLCTWFNRPWLLFTGRTMAQEIGEGWAEGLHPDDRERCLDIYTSAFDRRDPFEMEYRLRRHDGEFRWIIDSGVPLISDTGKFAGYIGSCRDITDRRHAEELLRGRVRERAEELASANERLKEEIQQRQRAETLIANENRILELIAAGSALGTVLKTLCRLIEQLMPGSTCMIRLQPNHAQSEPLSLERRSDRPPTADSVELFGSHGTAGPPPPLCSKRTLVKDIPGDRTGAVLRRREIRSYWLEPIVAPTGDLLGVLAVYSKSEDDPGPTELASGEAAARMAALAIERTSSEERSRHQLAQLAHVSRLATMGEMASGLAHELNQPLCAIVNFTEACVELLNSNGAQSHDLKKTMGDVAKQAERAGEVIRRLREFVRRSEPVRRPVDLNAVIREVVALTNNDARRSEVQVRLKLGKHDASALADPIQIQQVLVNLVRNAFEAMHEIPLRKRVLTIQTSSANDLVEVLVSDNGAGIPEPLRDKLFEPFFSTKREGMGLGLSISRSILEVHNGRIWATPNGAQGTTFRFTLPAIRRKKNEHGTNRIRRG